MESESDGSINDRGSETGAETTTRRAFLKGLLAVAATSAAASLGIPIVQEYYREQKEGSLESGPISQQELGEVFANSFPLIRPSEAILRLRGEERYEEVKNSHQKLQTAVLSAGITQRSVYKRYGSELRFYYPSDYKMPDKKTLNAVWDFIQKRYKLRYAPTSDSDLFVGDFGDLQSFTTKANIQGTKVDSLINFPADDSQKINGFWTEFAQNLFIAGSTTQQLAQNQENPSNQIGIAVYAAERGLSYQEYRDIAEGSVYLHYAPDRSEVIELTAYSENSYREVQNIFRN